MYQGMQAARSAEGPGTEVVCATPGCGEVVCRLLPNEAVRTSTSMPTGPSREVQAMCTKCGRPHKLDVAVQT